MNTYSLTYRGVIIMLLGFVLNQAGMPFVEEDLSKWVEFAFVLGGALAAFYGRFRKGDLKWFGGKA